MNVNIDVLNVTYAAPIGNNAFNLSAGMFERNWRWMDANLSQFQMAVIGSVTLHTIVYFLLTAFSTIIEILPLKKYKIQPNRPGMTVESTLKCYQLVLFNQFIIELPLYSLVPLYLRWSGVGFDYDSIPAWWTYFPKMFFCLVLEDTWHYFCHRALHWKPIYGYVHKIHHTFTSPFGIVAEYAHPVETIVLGFGFFIPMLLMCDHLLFMFTWFLVRMVQTHEAHLGYSLPLNPMYLIPFYGGAHAHDYHHKTFDCNYSSTFTSWDLLFGTFVDPEVGNATSAAKKERLFLQLPDTTSAKGAKSN